MPQFPAEHPDVYTQRVESTTFDNDYEDTLDGLAGLIFRKPISVDKVAKEIQPHLENVDLANSHIDVFAPRFVRRAIHYGAAFIVVDKQRVATDRKLDLSEVKSLNLRPYWTIYGWTALQTRPRYMVIDGRRSLQKIVFREQVILEDGEFGESEVTRYRVWRLPVVPLLTGTFQRVGFAEWQIWEERAETVEGKDRKIVEMIESGSTKLTRIPVAPLVAKPDIDDPVFPKSPTLIDLAYLCVKDFQQTSDHEANLHLCSSPVPWTAGLENSNALTHRPWGKGIMFNLALGGACGYAEPAGTGLAAMATQLESNKRKIRQKGLELVLSEPLSANESTATEQNYRAGKRTSRIAEMVHSIHDCLELALSFHAEWMGKGVDAGGEITMGIRGDELILTAADVAAYSTMVEKKQMSIKSMLINLQRGGVIEAEHDIEGELPQIIKEQKELLAIAPAPLAPAPGPNQPPNPAAKKPTAIPAAA